jgi:hypothetical protein
MMNRTSLVLLVVINSVWLVEGEHGPADFCQGGACSGGELVGKPSGPWPLPCSPPPNLGFPPISSFAKRPLVVANFNKWHDLQGFDPEEIANCSVSCLFLSMPSPSDNVCVEMADLVLIPPGVPPPPAAVKPPWQLWGYFSLESPENYPEMDDPAHMKPFDLEMTTRRTADVPLTYAPRMADIVRRPLTEDKSQNGQVLYLQGNCLEWRDNFVQELMEFVVVDSLGTCLKNGLYPDNVGTVQLIARYKFFLAIENSRSPDYVSERIFNSWIAGAVPIYHGAPNIGDFAPTRRSYILVSDFRNAQELGEYLNYLDVNETAYAEYLNFKDPTIPLNAKYLHASSLSFYAPNGETGVSNPFPPSNIDDISSLRRLGTRDERCNRKDAFGQIIDEEGIPVMEPRSKCFESHSLIAKGNNRGNRIASCRICETAYAAQQKKMQAYHQM